jgi:hypothetical protein
MVEQILEELLVVPLLLQAMIMTHLSMNTVWAISTDIKSQFYSFSFIEFGYTWSSKMSYIIIFSMQGFWGSQSGVIWGIYTEQ